MGSNKFLFWALERKHLLEKEKLSLKLWGTIPHASRAIIRQAKP